MFKIVEFKIKISHYTQKRAAAKIFRIINYSYMLKEKFFDFIMN